MAKELTSCQRTLLSSVRLEHGLDELTKLEEMLRRAEEATNRRKANALEDTFAQEPASGPMFPEEPDEKKS